MHFVQQPCSPLITGRLESWVEAQFQPYSDVRHPQDDGLMELLVKYQSRRLKAICEIMKGYLELKGSWKMKTINQSFEKVKL